MHTKERSTSTKLLRRSIATAAAMLIISTANPLASNTYTDHQYKLLLRPVEKRIERLNEIEQERLECETYVKECKGCGMDPGKVIFLAKQAGFSQQEALTATAIAICESHLHPKRTGINDNGTIDRGLWQINNAAWPDVSDWCAYNPKCSAEAALSIRNSKKGWRNWTVWKNGQAQAWVRKLEVAYTLHRNRDAIESSQLPHAARRSR